MALLHVTLATRDLARSARFFEQTLGWKPLSRPANIPMAAAWLAIDESHELHLVEAPDFEPSRCEREFGRHIAVSYPRAQFQALKDRLAAHGAELIPPARATPFERFFFRESNGYIFEVVAAERVPE
jgi:catechol 2,3-dioxygenase-like lactoylglutathione lyase family enzyme